MVFDPTIYDNLKVVFEGALYDLDRTGRILIVGREDLVDLASMSRRFAMRMEKQQDATCQAKLELSSNLVDFASELRRMRLADEVPGSRLTLSFDLPLRMAVNSGAIDEHLRAVWGDVAAVQHERVESFAPHAGDRSDETPSGIYRITLPLAGKIDEDNIEDVVSLLDHLVLSLETIEQIGNSR